MVHECFHISPLSCNIALDRAGDALRIQTVFFEQLLGRARLPKAILDTDPYQAVGRACCPHLREHLCQGNTIGIGQALA